MLRKKSKDNSKEIATLKYENTDLESCLVSSMEEIASLKRQIKELKSNLHTEPMKKVSNILAFFNIFLHYNSTLKNSNRN